jgi:hypothetical protein
MILTILFPSLCTYCDPSFYDAPTFKDFGDTSTFFFNGTNVHLIHEGKIHIDDSITNFGLNSMIYSVIPDSMSIDQFIKEKLNFYKNIPLFPHQLIEQSNDFLNQHKHYIGVHNRYTDNLDDKPKFNTKLEQFIQKIKTFHDKTILICSDNQSVLNHFKDKPNVIFANTCSMTNSDQNIYFQPLYEMMLLSNSTRIIGSCCSTFSYEAAFFKGTDIELFEPIDYNNIDYSTFIWKTYSLSNYKHSLN